MPDRRHDLRQIHAAALQAVNGRDRVRAALAGAVIPSPVYLIAIGKAAAAMTHGALDVLGQAIVSGLVVTKHGYVGAASRCDSRLRVITAGHPVPDADSLRAGACLLEFIRDAPSQATFLVLISGGASALVEVLPEGIGLADLARVNEWLHASGHAIDAVNRVRKQLSCIKGGRLAAHLNGRRAVQLLISDVPGDRVGDVGSGLLVPDADPAAMPPLPSWLAGLLTRRPAPVPPPAIFRAIETRVIATARDAREAAAAAAQRLGYAATCYDDLICGEAAAQAISLARVLATCARGVHIWSGETTVTLPSRPGRGGRNQHLALAIAIQIAGADDVTVLTGATDGSDGPGSDAGAIVDGNTVQRGAQAGKDARACLRNADAGGFLAASDDLFQTGPTGTNVMDLLIALRDGPPTPYV